MRIVTAFSILGLLAPLALLSACDDVLLLRARAPESGAATTSAQPNDAPSQPSSKGGPILTAGEPVMPPLNGPLTGAASRVQVFPGKDPGHRSVVVAVLDFHTSADSEDKGFDLLRDRAASLGADAVIGAEFEHGEGSEPSHLSGMAVRFIN